MRCVLAVLIAVVQVAGSWLCCCGPDRLFVVRTTQAVPSHCEELAVASAAPATCPHCKQSKSESQPTPAKPSDPPRKHPPLPDQCPCGGLSIEAVPAVAAATEHESTGPVLPPPFPAEVYPSIGLTATTGVTPGGVSELPFLPAQSRLYAHHVLRC